MYLIKFFGGINSSPLIKEFKTKKVMMHKKWMAICEWKYDTLPKKVFLEDYRKRIFTKGHLVYKKSYLLRDKERVIIRGWAFSFIPSRFKVEEKILYCLLPPDTFCLRFIKRNGHFNNLILPLNMDLDSEDYVALGLLQGEMISSYKGKSRHYFSFSNSDYTLVNNVLRLLRKFNIPSNMFSYQIYVNYKNVIRREDSEYILYWSKKLDVSRDSFVRTFYKEMNTSFPHGSIILKYHNTMFRLFFQYFLDAIKENIEKKEMLAKHYLVGLIAAEGGVHLSSSLSLNYISIGGSKERDIFHYGRVLKCLGITYGSVMKGVSNEEGVRRGWKRGTGGYMIIQGFNNFKLFYEQRLIITPFKYLNFLIGMLNHRNSKKDISYASLLSEFETYKRKYNLLYRKIMMKKSMITFRENEVLKLMKEKKLTAIRHISSNLNISCSSTSRILCSLCRKGILKREPVSGRTIKYVTI